MKERGMWVEHQKACGVILQSSAVFPTRGVEERSAGLKAKVKFYCGTEKVNLSSL